MRLTRRGFAVPYVALAALLVVATALAVGAVLAHAGGRRAEDEADWRLAEGERVVRTTLDVAHQLHDGGKTRVHLSSGFVF